MKLRISSILGLGRVGQLANASIVGLDNPNLFPFVFDGVAVFNYPNWNTQDTRDRTLEGENFFCYATEKGYLSFGWWLDASPETDYSHCHADSVDYICYEYSEKIECTEMGCKAHIRNYWAGNNTLKVETDYVFRDSSLARPELGNLSTFYRDEEQGPSAVGTRRVLSSSPSTILECCQALKAFRKVRDRHNLELGFDFEDICPLREAVKSSWWQWRRTPLDRPALSTARHNFFSARAANVKVH
ncbi:hypothetical protein BJX65DRAFT_320600 [Aspergillus insuetus]